MLLADVRCERKGIEHVHVSNAICSNWENGELNRGKTEDGKDGKRRKS